MLYDDCSEGAVRLRLQCLVNETLCLTVLSARATRRVTAEKDGPESF